jgi:cytochrome b subunit of formate dehydrogenase
MAVPWILPVAVPAAPDNSDCLACHTDKELSKKTPDGKTVSLFVDEAKYAASVHGKQTCVACHTDTTEAPHPDGFQAKPVECAKCHQRQSEEYGASVHGLARQHANGKAATCTDCHGVHDAVKHTSQASPLHHSRLAQTCGKCHPKATEDVANSVHGKALAKGIEESPTCTDCHSEHKIEKLAGATPMKISAQVCSRCHASERLNTKFRIPGDRVKTFFDSYHGLAIRLGSASAANCASCHGWHDVLPSSDPASPIHLSNLPKTCGECHPDIGTRIAKGAIRVHEPPGAAEGKHWIVNFIAWFYIWVIILVIGGMFAHNALDYFVKARAHIRKVAAAAGEQRFSAWARAQHFAMIVLFVLLAYTGFVHKYPEASWSWPFQVLPSANYMRGMIHRIAGWAFTGLLIGHCIALLGTTAGRVELKALWVRTKDLQDVIATLGFNLGLRSTPPTRERFNYVEKSEYWALMWGSIVMIVTGIMLIFTEAVLHFLPQVWLDVAQVIHYYEALLATLAILVWHLYAVVFDPNEYPMNPAWLIGKKPLPHSAAHPEEQPDAAP